MWKVPLFDLNYDDREKQAVCEVLQSKWLSSGEKTKGFEDQFGDYLGGGVDCCALANCTAALHLALLVAGVGPMDEVILPGLTFVADLNVVKILGAKPVLADVSSLDDWCVSPKEIIRKITPRTKVVIVVHFAGFPCEMDAIVHECHGRGIVVVEDVAHAIGGTYRGAQCGTMGDIGCFSFFSNKNLSVGEGGMLVSANKNFVEKARLLRSHGMNSMTVQRHHGNSLSYDVLMPGFNYRMDEIRAALGIVQLAKLDAANQQRAQLVGRYDEALKSIDQVHLPWKTIGPERKSSFHIYPILLAEEVDRMQFMTFLKDKGVQTSIHYPYFNDFKAFCGEFASDLYYCRKISTRGVTLPLFPTMSEDHFSRVVTAVQEFFG